MLKARLCGIYVTVCGNDGFFEYFKYMITPGIEYL